MLAPSRRVAVEHDGLDELTRVLGHEDGYLGLVLVSGEGEGPLAALARPQNVAGEIARVEAGHEEGGRDPQRPYVLLDLGLAVKVVDLCELAVGGCGQEEDSRSAQGGSFFQRVWSRPTLGDVNEGAPN